MIYTTSRYYDGPLYQDGDTVFVNRKFPGNQTVKMFGYIWVDGDRPDQIAAYFLGDPKAWWKIMDVNPDLFNCTYISPGTPIRIPYA
jgi:hypothetical protein